MNMKKITIYQVLPRLWGANENNCGKFSNIDNDTLDYLKWMGISHVWLTGMLAHASKSSYPGVQQVSHPQFVKGEAGSPYAITNYYDTNPYLADDPENRMLELEETIERIHKAGLKVIIDFVPNHVSRNYNDHTESSFGANDNKDVHWDLNNDFYYYPGERLNLANEDDFNEEVARFKSRNLSGEFNYIPIWLVKKAKEILSEDETGHGANGEVADGSRLKCETNFKNLLKENEEILKSYDEYPARATGNNFSASPSINDWYDTVKLNYCDFHTPTWDKMYNIIDFWASKGVDGFRCDMVELVPKSFMKWLILESKKKYKDLIFIAEVYQKELYNEYAHNVGFDLLYDKSGLYDALRAIVDGNVRGYNRDSNSESNAPINLWESTKEITKCWQSSGLVEENLLNFLENHDEQRFASDYFGKEPEFVYPALYTSLFLNKASFMLYFGEEFGERGMDEEGQSGLDGRTTIYDWWSPTQIEKLYKLIHTDEFKEVLKNHPFKRNFSSVSSSSAAIEAYHEDFISCLQKTGADSADLEVLFKYNLAIRLAASHPSIQKGKFYDLCYCNFGSVGFDGDRHYAFLRGEGEDVLLVFCNFGRAASEVKFIIPQDAIDYLNIRAIQSSKVKPEENFELKYNEEGFYEAEIKIGGYDAKVIRL